MTVQADAFPVPGQDADEEYAQIFRVYYTRLVRYLAWLLKAPYHPLAEDLAQEAFLALWRDYVAKDGIREPEKVYGLLKVIARNRVHEHFKAGRNNESTIDFADPANRNLDGASHGYGLGTPGVSMLVAELDAAMERMTAASEKWRGLNKESARLRMLLADGYRDHLGGLSAYNRQEFEGQAAATEQEEETALAAFQETCRQVGDLRAEIERTSGANWRSCVGMPASQAPHAAYSYAKDPSATHCSKGHLLDRLNTAFTADGERRCRTCRREINLRSKPRQVSTAVRSGARASVDSAVIERARELLADPEQDHTIRSVAELLGVGTMTLYRAFPGGVAAVRGDRLSVPLEAARELLADPAYLTVGVARIAKQVGSSDTAIYKRLPVAELRAAAKAKAAELEAAR